MNSTLMRAVAEYAVFLGRSLEEDVNPDIAVEQLEQLSQIMKQLTADERADFFSFAQKMADEEAQSPHSKVYPIVKTKMASK